MILMLTFDHRRIGLAALFTLLTCWQPSLADEPAWRAGVAVAKITPRQSMWMAGYAARTRPSEGVAQDLYAKALALEDAEKNRLVLVTMDLIGVPFQLIVGPKGVRTGEVEVKERRTGERVNLAPDAAVKRLVELISARRVLA